jgi:hypothetical protein
MCSITIDDYDTIQYGIYIFTAVEMKPPVGIFLCAITIDNCCFNYTGVVWVGAPNCDCLTQKVDVAVAVASVSAWLNNDSVAVVGVVYCRLNVVEICRAVIINGDNNS